MAAAVAASVPPWIPEDDLLLKNAVEGGASLEALAKGAVRFSRKFTLRELRDRWYSLLYDPVISKEASAKMVEFELSVKNNAKVISTAELSAKRKLESVRQLYYAMKKKTRGQHAGCCDSIEFEGNRSHFGFVGKECYNQIHSEVPSFNHDNMGNIVSRNVRDEIVGFQSCGRAKEMELPHSLPENSPSFHAEGFSSPLAVWEMVDHVSANAIPTNVTTGDRSQQEFSMRHSGVEMDGKQAGLSGMDATQPETVLRDDDDVHVLNNSTSISECDFAYLPESLLNFGNEDEQHLVDEGEKETIAKSCYDGVLVTCPNDPYGDVRDVNDSQRLVSDEIVENSAIRDPSEAITEASFSGHVKQHGHLQTELSLPSTFEVNAENYDGEMECILNSEDLEIPCNDDILLHKELTSSRMVRPSGEIGYQSIPYADLKNDGHELSLVKKEEHPAQSLLACQMKTLEVSPVINPSHQFGCGFKCLSLEDLTFRQAVNDDRAADQCIIKHAALNSADARLVKPEPLHDYDIMGLPSHEQACSPQQVTSVPEAGPSMLNDNDFESDDDVPSYSEVEAMILQMELFPDNTDSYIQRDVSRYQNEDARRSIIRLEQCAQSSIQRALAFRGALAVLYGRHLKHYIRETEVILGRATNDMEVDIDLRREGPANKISRRQALLKLEADGSFLLKNLGRSSIFLNGKEVINGHGVVLGSSSLIEIGEMAFMFEINSKSIARHLTNATKKLKGNNVKFEWSEGVA